MTDMKYHSTLCSHATLIEVPAFSLSHMTDKTYWWLADASDLPFLCGVHAHGVFMTVAQPHHCTALPQDLRDIFAICHAAGYGGWILLDIDGDELPNLPVYKD